MEGGPGRIVRQMAVLIDRAHSKKYVRVALLNPGQKPRGQSWRRARSRWKDSWAPCPATGGRNWPSTVKKQKRGRRFTQPRAREAQVEVSDAHAQWLLSKRRRSPRQKHGRRFGGGSVNGLCRNCCACESKTTCCFTQHETRTLHVEVSGARAQRPLLASTRNTPSAPSPTVVGLPGAETLVLCLAPYVRREAHHTGAIVSGGPSFGRNSWPGLFVWV